MNDTARLPKLSIGSRDGSVASLSRIAANLELLSNVLAGFPDKNPAVWHSAELSKQLKDLTLTCEQLRRYAEELAQMAQDLKTDA